MPNSQGFLVAAFAFLVLTACAAQPSGGMPPNFAVQPVEQTANWAAGWWGPRHEEKIEQARNADIDLLMLGDSITQGWEGPGAEVWQQYYQDRNGFNLGFGGDRTEHVLWRLRHGAVENMEPKLVVLMIGTNNTAHRMDPASYTAEGIQMIVAELRERLPSSKVLLLAIFPHHASPYNDMRERNEEINHLIASLADGETVHYLNLNQVFLDEGGALRTELMPDLLHPNAAGYAVWAEAMEPTLSKLLR
jgi:beta-glucosidase